MSRHSSSKAQHFNIAYRWGEFELSWTVDFYYKGSRQRFPRRFRRWTNYDGAMRFAKKHGVEMPIWKEKASTV